MRRCFLKWVGTTKKLCTLWWDRLSHQVSGWLTLFEKYLSPQEFQATCVQLFVVNFLEWSWVSGWSLCGLCSWCGRCWLRCRACTRCRSSWKIYGDLVLDVQDCGVKFGHVPDVDGVGEDWGELDEDDDGGDWGGAGGACGWCTGCARFGASVV